MSYKIQSHRKNLKELRIIMFLSYYKQRNPAISAKINPKIQSSMLSMIKIDMKEKF